MVTTNPGIYFKEYMPWLARPALICELVYDNIYSLFASRHDAGYDVASFITLRGDEDIIKCRCLLGYYKPTIGGTAADVRQSVIDFNKLLEDNNITPHDFTGVELSDAEHFYASAVMTMVPILGLVATPVGAVAWDLIVPGFKSIYSNIKETWNSGNWEDFADKIEKDMRHDIHQLTGPDLAGHAYGMSVTYVNNAEWYAQSAIDFFSSKKEDNQ